MFVTTLLAAIVLGIYLCFRKSYKFFDKLKIPVKPPSIPFGNFHNFLYGQSPPPGVQIAEVYNYLKERGYKYGGMYIIHQPSFMPIDLDLIRDILSKNFHSFDDKGFYYNEHDQPISANLFFLGGEKWKNIRTKMTPAFSSGKLKMMISILLNCRYPMLEHIESCRINHEPLDIKEVAAKFTTDIIGSTAFGIECNSFKNPDAEFRKNGKAVFDFDYIRILQGMITMNFKKFAAKMRMVIFPPAVEAFFVNAIKDTITYRKEKDVAKNDFMQILIKLMDEGQITFNELVAQAFVFFIAGFETSSTTLTFCLFELAKRQDIQDKVRQEINSVLGQYNGEVTYEALGQLTFTKQVIDETLRKYPPLPVINRISTKPYQIPGEDIILPVGTQVAISAIGLHYDPDIYPNPKEFDPDRFSPENANKINPYSYLPFGEGPRLCIGQRFGIMETKIGLVTLLKDYRYKLNTKTSPDLQLDFTFILSPKGDILLDIEKLN